MWSIGEGAEEVIANGGTKFERSIETKLCEDICGPYRKFTLYRPYVHYIMWCSICNVYRPRNLHFWMRCCGVGLWRRRRYLLAVNDWKIVFLHDSVLFILFFLYTFGVKLKHNFLNNNLAACKRAKLEKHAGWHMKINMHFAAICPICICSR